MKAGAGGALVKSFLGFVATSLALVAGVVVSSGAVVTGGAVDTGWRSFLLSGMPDSAQVHSVAAGSGGFAAVGNDIVKGDDRSGFVVWRSTDGMAWTEVYRAAGDLVADANVVAAGGGFAVVGARCAWPNQPGSAREEARCEPFAVASADGGTWTPVQIDAGGGPPGSGALVSDVAGDGDGTLVAVGWAARTGGDRDPAVWRSSDGGRSWTRPAAPIPSTAGTPDEMRTLGRAAGGWVAAGLDELERGGGRDVYFTRQEPRLWRSADGLVWVRVDPPEHASDVHLLTAAGTVSYAAGGATGGVSVWRAGPDGRWSSTDNGFPQGNPSSLWVLEADDDGLILGGLEPQPDSRKRPVLWGSNDGRSYRRTLTVAEPVRFTTAVRSGDHWFVYGTSSAGAGQVNRGWVASVKCATGRACSDLAPDPARLAR